MKAQQLTLSRFVVFIALLLVLVPGVAVLAVAQSQPVDPATPEMLIENTSRFDASARLRGHAGSDSTVAQVAVLHHVLDLHREERLCQQTSTCRRAVGLQTQCVSTTGVFST